MIRHNDPIFLIQLAGQTVVELGTKHIFRIFLREVLTRPKEESGEDLTP
jgi:hypothetical protein